MWKADSPSASNWALSVSLAALAERGHDRPARHDRTANGGIPKHHHRVADELVDSPALGQKSFRQRGEMARRLAHQNIGGGRFGDAGEVLDIGEQDRHLLPHSAKLGGDGTIENPLYDVLRNKASEGPDCAAGDRHRPAEFVNLGDAGGHRRIVRRRQCPKPAGLTRYALY
jgi:hypothetical protein